MASLKRKSAAPTSAESVHPSTYAPDSFAGKVVVVTGAAHGIGRATALMLASLGASVVLLDINEKNLRHVEEELNSLNQPNLCLAGDVGRESTLKRTVSRTMKKFGRIDGWVTNAMLNPGGALTELDPAVLENSWNINTAAAMTAAHLVAPIMAAQGGGALVNISSIMAYMTNHSQTAYTSGKSGLNGLTRALACELAQYYIRVNAIMPGTIFTGSVEEMVRNGTPQKLSEAYYDAVMFGYGLTQTIERPGAPNDIAAAAVFLLSDAAAFITGTTLTVDGGYTCDIHSLWDGRRTKGAAIYKKRLRQCAKLKEKLANADTANPPARKRRTVARS